MLRNYLPRISKFETKPGYVKLYCVFENQQSPAYHSLYSYIFHSIKEFFSIKDSSETTLPRSLKLGTNLRYQSCIVYLNIIEYKNYSNFIYMFRMTKSVTENKIKMLRFIFVFFLCFVSFHICHSIIFIPELQLNEANISDTEAPFSDLHLSVTNRFVSSKIYNTRDDFDFDIVNFPFFGW